MIASAAKQVLGSLLLVTIIAVPTLAETAGEAQFQRGFYLQTHEGDLEGAAAAFEKVVAEGDAPEKLRAEAGHRLAQCREDLATADFARVMPPEAIAYVEINRPGDHVAHLARTLGLVHEAGLAPQDLKPEATPLGDGLFLPNDFTISPALISELKKFQGAAVAVTSVDDDGPTGGLVVLHPGNSDLLRGVIETSIQMLEPAEPIEGFKTYRGPENIWIAATTRLFLASPARGDLAAAIARLQDSSIPSLASSRGLQPFADDRNGAMMFAYVDGQRLVAELEPQLAGRDAAVARSVFDLDHFESLAAGVRTSEKGVHLQARLGLKEGHHNLVYALMRTSPVTGRALGQVPEGAAVVGLLGLNPHESSDEKQPSDGAAFEYLTGMDLGREVFANIEELALYVLPAGSGSGEFPNVGAVLTVKDPAKSEALWNQLLSIPAMVETASADAAQEIEIGGHEGRQYQLPILPPLVIVRAGDDAILAGTKGAVTAAAEQKSITEDEVFAGLLDRITPATSKAVLVHVGRALAIAESLAEGHEARELREIKGFISDLTISVVTDEQPTRFGVRVYATGLPNVPDLVKAVAGRKDRREEPVRTAVVPAGK